MRGFKKADANYVDITAFVSLLVYVDFRPAPLPTVTARTEQNKNCLFVWRSTLAQDPFAPGANQVKAIWNLACVLVCLCRSTQCSHRMQETS